MRYSKLSVLVCLCLALASLGCEPEKKKQKGAEGKTTATTPSMDGKDQNKPGPDKAQKLGVDDGDVDAHLKILRELEGCDAKGDAFWCKVAAGMAKREAGALPEETKVELGWTIFIPTQGKPDAAKLAGEPIALGIKVVTDPESKTKDIRAQVTHVVARNPENAKKIKGLGKQVGAILTGAQPASEPIIVHDPQLLAYLRDQGARATNTITKSATEPSWAIADEKNTRLYRIGDRYATVHRERPRPDKPEGVWLSVYTPVELSGEIAPTKELGITEIVAALDCTHNAELAKVCKGLSRFDKAAEPESMSGQVEGLSVYFGEVHGSAKGSEPGYGALLIRPGKEGAEIAFSVVRGTSEEENKALDTLAEVVHKGGVAKGNAALAYLLTITKHPSAFGPAAKSDGKSALVLRRGLFQGGPDERTISYFRAEGDRFLVVTHEHINGNVWFWDLAPVDLGVEQPK